MTKPIVQSKTIGGNVLGAAIVTVVQHALGIELSGDIIAAIFAVGNIALRFLTDRPLSGLV